MKKTFLTHVLIACLLCTFQVQAKTSGYPLLKLNNHSGKSLTATVPTGFIIPHDTCLDKKFSIVFYLIQDSLYTLPNNTLGNPSNVLSTFALTQIINTLNTAFARICVSFENCKTVIIPNFSYNKWTAGSTDSVVTANWYTDKTINIYIPAKEFLSAPHADSTAYTPVFPLTGTNRPKDFIVLFKGPSYPMQPVYATSNSAGIIGSDIIHVMGHFFGLRHTFAETSSPTVLPLGPSTEQVNDFVNCPVFPAVVHGDGFCDTEADPYPQGFNILAPNCQYDQATGVTDAFGHFYNPPTDNFMSVYTCRCHFSQEQYNYMARFIMTRRLYLH